VWRGGSGSAANVGGAEKEMRVYVRHATWSCGGDGVGSTARHIVPAGRCGVPE